MNTKIRVTKSLVTGIAALALLAGCATASPKAGDPDFRGDGTDGVKGGDKNSSASVSKTGGITDGMETVEFNFIDNIAVPKGEAIHVEIPEIVLKDSEALRTTITEAYTITSVETDKLGLCAVAIDVEYRDGADMSLRDTALRDGEYATDPDLGALQSVVNPVYANDFKNISFQELGDKPTEPGITMTPDYSSIVIADTCPASGDVLGIELNFRGAYLEGLNSSPYETHVKLDVTADSEGTTWASATTHDLTGDNTSIYGYKIDSAGKWMPK